jgi:putative tricarboxylic transport membrane protein
MPAMLASAVHALTLVLDPTRLLIMLGGVLLGLALGVVPGLGGIVGLALLIPFTYHLDGYTAFALLLGMAATTTVSDFIPAVLFGVPGTVGAAATVLDGHPLAKQGQVQRAFGAGYAASLAGGIFGALLLAVAIPVLRPIVLYLGSPELLAFCIFGLSMVAVLSGNAPLKGLTIASLGLMLSLIGSDPQTGTLRWTFGTLYLWDHLPLVPVTLGIFALPELADMAIARTGITDVRVKGTKPISNIWEGVADAARNWWLILRCSGLGALLGAVPGIGSAVIDWMAYAHALKTEKNTEKFGHGDIRGVIAAESSNNAKEGGHLIPTIAFGMPAGASMALLLSAFMMHGFTPGPEMLTKHLDVTYSIIWTLTIAHIMGAVICVSSSGMFAKLATVRVGILVPLVLSIIFLGAFDGSQSWGDLYSMAIFGAVGWVMKQLGWPRPPLILGLVLGSMFERYYFISTQIYGLGFFTRPVVAVVLLAALWVVLGPSIRAFLRMSRPEKQAARHRGFPRLVRRFDHHTAFTLLLIVISGFAAWVATAWDFDAKLMPLTAGGAALCFGCLTLFQQMLADNEVVAVTTGPHGPAYEAPLHGLSGPVFRIRALRFFLWLAGVLGVAALIGLLPALFVLMLLLARLEFHESWRTSAVLSAGMTFALWFVFGRIFSTPWPLSVLGDFVPYLREVSRLL